jgi:tetratricopeptide (TPR) repeat protein
MRKMVFYSILCCVSFLFANIRLELAKKYVTQQEFSKAMKEYKGYMLENPQDGSIYPEVAKLYLSLNNTGQAQVYFQKVLAKEVNHALSLKGVGDILYSKGNLEQALKFYRKYDLTSKKAHETIQPKIDKIVALLKSGKPLTSLNKPDTNAASNLQPNLAGQAERYQTDEFKKGFTAYQAGQNTKALGHWRKVLKKDPGNPGAYYFAGVNRYNLGELDKAEYNLKRSFSYPDKGFNAHYYLGRIHEKRGEKQKAIAHYEKYIPLTKSKSGKNNVKNKLAKLKGGSSKSSIVSKNNDSVKAPLLKNKTTDKKLIVKENKNGIRFIWNEGQGLEQVEEAWNKFNNENINDAINLLKEVNLSYPTSDNARNAQLNLLALYTQLGLDKSIVNLSKMMRRVKPKEPILSSILFYEVGAHLRMGDKKSAQAKLEKVKANESSGPLPKDLLKMQTLVFKKTKQPLAAIDKIKESITKETDPSQKRDLKFQLAREYLDVGKNANADKYLGEIIENCKDKDKMCRKAAYLRADVTFKNKEWNKAKEFYELALNQFPDSIDAAWGQYQIGNILRHKKDYRSAMKAYNVVVENFPRSYWAEQALWKRDDAIWRKEYEGVLTP